MPRTTDDLGMNLGTDLCRSRLGRHSPAEIHPQALLQGRLRLAGRQLLCLFKLHRPALGAQLPERVHVERELVTGGHEVTSARQQLVQVVLVSVRLGSSQRDTSSSSPRPGWRSRNSSTSTAKAHHHTARRPRRHGATPPALASQLPSGENQGL
jgi:hypothetical protein